MEGNILSEHEDIAKYKTIIISILEKINSIFLFQINIIIFVINSMHIDYKNNNLPGKKLNNKEDEFFTVAKSNLGRSK